LMPDFILEIFRASQPTREASEQNGRQTPARPAVSPPLNTDAAWAPDDAGSPATNRPVGFAENNAAVWSGASSDEMGGQRKTSSGWDQERNTVGNLKLDAMDKRRISTALESAFSLGELERLVTDHVPAMAREVSWRESLSQTVFEVREVAVRQGVVDRLLIGAVEERPNRSDLLALALALAQRPGWNMPIGTHSLDIGSALEQVTSGPANPFFDTTRLARWMIAVERQVCQVRCGYAYGTGFLVAPDLVLTCHHVVEWHLTGSVSKADVQVRFDYRRTVTGAEPPDDDGAWIGLDPGWPIPNSRSSTADFTLVGEAAADELDFALLKLEKQVGLDSPPAETRPRGWVDMSRDRSLPEAGSAIFIVQHPANDKAGPPQMPLQLALSTPGYEGVNAIGTRITYTPSTKPGSSGSPVFDRTLAAVALHHCRGEARTNRGIPLAKIRAALDPDVRALLIAPPQGM
jgi:hypothetical protein